MMMIHIIYNPAKMDITQLLLLFLCLSLVCAQITINITTLNDGAVPTTMLFPNGSINSNPSFDDVSSRYNCSLSFLYTYEQTAAELANNQPYYINLYGLATSTTVSVSTVYHILSPTFNSSYAQSITCTTTNCTIAVTNNCPSSINYFNYFDMLRISVDNLPPLTFNVLCNADFAQNTFEWGMLILIMICTATIAVMAIFSKAWSLGGNGIQFNIYLIIAFSVIIILGGIIGAFVPQVVQYVLLTLSFLFGIIGVGICINEVIFLFRLGFLRFTLVKKGVFQLHVSQIVSLTLAVGVVVGWWQSDKNWIVNDIVSMCMIVACIKLFKFTSLKLATLCFIIIMAIQMAFVIAIHFTVNTSYNNLFLNDYNYPFQLQLPTINPVYNSKCAWLPVTAIIYPGMLLSYLRRFDSCRSTNIYLITSTGLFLLGGITWMFISIVNPYIFPLGLISETLMITSVCIFAYKRVEIRTLWDGKFYDEEFANREDLKYITELVSVEKRASQVNIQKQLTQNLMIKNRGDSQSSYREGPSPSVLSAQL